NCQVRIFFETALDPPFIKPLIVKAAKLGRKSPESPNQRELRCDDVNSQSEPRLRRERQAVFRFDLRLRQRLAGEDKVRIQIVACVGCILDITDAVCSFESPKLQITASSHVFHPGHDKQREANKRSRLKTF